MFNGAVESSAMQNVVGDRSIYKESQPAILCHNVEDFQFWQHFLTTWKCHIFMQTHQILMSGYRVVSNLSVLKTI